MFRVNMNSLCRNPSVDQGRALNKESQVDKFHELITRFALGFDPNNPPEYVTLYNSAMNLYDEKSYESARDILKDALRLAQKQDAPQQTLDLFQKELEPIENFLEEVKKTKVVAKRLERVMVFIFGGISFLTTNYAYLRLRPQEATRIARNSF